MVRESRWSSGRFPRFANSQHCVSTRSSRGQTVARAERQIVDQFELIWWRVSKSETPRNWFGLHVLMIALNRRIPEPLGVRTDRPEI